MTFLLFIVFASPKRQISVLLLLNSQSLLFQLIFLESGRQETLFYSKNKPNLFDELVRLLDAGMLQQCIYYYVMRFVTS